MTIQEVLKERLEADFDNPDAVNDPDELEPLKETVTSLKSELEEAGYALDYLAAYLRHRQIAAEFRKVGSLQITREHERECDRLYGLLPDWAKVW